MNGARIALFSLLSLAACSSASNSPPTSTGGLNGVAGDGEGGIANSGGHTASSGDGAADSAGNSTHSTGGDDMNHGGVSRACPSVREASDAGTVGPKSLSEASGLVASRVHPRVLWLHNDSGDAPRIFATRDDGLALGVVELEGAEARDWEDIAQGPGPIEGKSYLFIGDIGDNARERESVHIYRVEEPALDDTGRPKVSSVRADRIEVRYAKGPRDAETLMVDPLSGDLYIVEKNLTDSGVYRIPRPGVGDSSVTTKAVAHVNLLLSTGGDVLPTGEGFAVRTYMGITYWPRDPAQPLEAAFDGTPCSLPLTSEPQGEAFGFFRDGSGYFTLSEGEAAMLHAYRFK